VVREKERYYLQRNWVLETTIVEQLSRLWQARPNDLFDPALFLLPPELAPAQADVVKSVLSRSLTVAAGGPGTGKSYTAIQTLNCLAAALLKGVLRVKIAAPTGKAADRLAQALTPSDRLEIETLTLHRLLRLQPGRVRLFENHLLDADLIIVDEASMIDASLFAHLLKAIPNGCRLLILGDADQLPPVDGGSVFRDLTDLLAIRLQFSHRTQKEGLHRLFNAVRNGDATPLLDVLEPLPADLYAWIESEFRLTDPEQFERTRIICPLRKGPFGVDALNQGLLSRLQKRLTIGQTWSAPILVTSNEAHLKLYNGTPGTLKGTYQGGAIPYGSEEVQFADGRTFTLRQLSGYEFAFALSAHKSQGSEFNRVVCLMPLGSEEFCREALYTAMTRAKEEIRLVGSREILEKMLYARSHVESGFRERMDSLFK
jgi:exodeoxyribonuclease V alpha subunit